ncbi:MULTISPECIES: hypothetical protein [Pseudobacillus]|uniref:hypothetical protein n=1 Tax=Pseudobacillus TaxID=108525 RepID=UPI00387A328A
MNAQLIGENPFNFRAEFEESRSHYLVTNYDTGRRRVLAFGFPTEREAEIWIEEQQLLFILPDEPEASI